MVEKYIIVFMETDSVFGILVEVSLVCNVCLWEGRREGLAFLSK